MVMLQSAVEMRKSYVENIVTHLVSCVKENAVGHQVFTLQN